MQSLTGRDKSILLCSVSAAILFFGNTDHAKAAPSCAVTPTGLAFGEVSSAILSNSTQATSGSISFSCTGFGKGSTLRVCISLGDYTSSPNNRAMSSGGNKLNYNIYSDAGRNTVWGTATDGGIVTRDVAMSGGNASGSVPVYGNVLSAQTTAVVGSYSHTLVANSTNVFMAGSTNNACTSFVAQYTLQFSSTNTASISNNCTLNSTNLNFGTAGFLLSNVDTTNTLSVKCINSTPYTMSLDNGLGSGATASARKMTSSSNTVTYSIYSDIGRSSVWGNTVGTNTVSGTGTGTTQSFTGYGRVPPQTTPAPGAYSDTIVAGITF